VNAAFAAWASVADLTFMQIADGGEAFNAPARAAISALAATLRRPLARWRTATFRP
jgi:hypothetical protein